MFDLVVVGEYVNQFIAQVGVEIFGEKGAGGVEQSPHPRWIIGEGEKDGRVCAVVDQHNLARRIIGIPRCVIPKKIIKVAEFVKMKLRIAPKRGLDEMFVAE